MKVTPADPLNVPPAKLSVPILVKVVAPAPPKLSMPALQLIVPLLVNKVTQPKEVVPVLVFVMVPTLLMVPNELLIELKLRSPVIDQILLLVIVRKPSNIIFPCCQTIVPLLVRLACRYLSLLVFIVNVLVASTVNCLPSVP